MSLLHLVALGCVVGVAVVVGTARDCTFRAGNSSDDCAWHSFGFELRGAAAVTKRV